ncbi:sensor histidine kinase KdpD [Microbispora sp. H13382]|uniref:sensor histidine kinase n=1 Tax=Microbispora sp. H13382 TaxID=2729112 RepID=UPI001C719041|nr:ATP-binding protein [Microbispora sp. H13382]
MIITACAWLWAISAAPYEARELMALVGGVSAALLSGAVAAIVHYSGTGRRLREQAEWAGARFTWLERETLRMAEESLPSLGRQVRDGASVADALSQIPQPPDGPLRHLLRAAGHELELLERERAVTQASRDATEGEISRLIGDTLPELFRRIQTDRMSVSAALAEIRQPEQDPLRDLLRETARQLSESERRGTAVMAACAGAAARVQAQATSLLARLRELEEQYGEHEVFADLLDLDHRVSQMSRLADNIALLSGGRSGRRWTRPIVMESVLRGAMGRISAYRRIRLHSTSTVAVAGYAAEGVMHALAELMDNAATFSAHGTEVHVYVDEEDAGVVITIEDSGLGMRPRERQHATNLVSEPLDLRTLSGTRLGLAVVGRLVDKYGLTVSFRSSARGGTGVVMLIPRLLITQPLSATVPPDAEASVRRPVQAAVRAPAVPAQEGPADESEDLLPRRRRGQTLAEATRARQASPVKPAREGPDSAARFAAFRQAGGRGRTSSSAPPPAPGDS